MDAFSWTGCQIIPIMSNGLMVVIGRSHERNNVLDHKKKKKKNHWVMIILTILSSLSEVEDLINLFLSKCHL